MKVFLTCALLGRMVVTVAAQEQCGTLVHYGFGPNMPNKPMRYALTAKDCCAFCHSLEGCKFWTWNGPSPGNGYCYGKASNVRGESSNTSLSGGVAPGPPMPPPLPTHITVSDEVRNWMVSFWIYSSIWIYASIWKAAARFLYNRGSFALSSRYNE
jgi:hypothetical protein